MKKVQFPKLQKRKIKKKWIIGGAIVLLVIIAGVRFITFRSRMNNVMQKSTKINTTVSTGTIQTSVSGTGTISYVDTTDIVMPTDLTVDEILVSEGSNVTAGDVIATVDEASLAMCLNQIEDAIAEVDDTISSESSSSTSQSITAGVAGRVKKIYADEDDSVVDIMSEQGALMLLSVDDLMMVTLEGVTSLAVGDEVVVSSGDITTDGMVESVGASSVVVTFDDSVFSYEEEITVTDSEGAALGTGKAYIHQMIKVVGSSGTISSLNVSLNSSVSASTKVFTLDSNAKSAEYLQAVKEREQLVELLNTLIAIQTNGGIVAPVDGMLQTVNTTSDSTTSSGQSSGGGYMMGSTNAVQPEQSVKVAQAIDTETEVLVADSEIQMVSAREDMGTASGMQQLTVLNTMTSLGAETITKAPLEAPVNLTGGAGVINGTTIEMEYADKEDATEWIECTADKTEVAAGIWYVRMKETETMSASAAVKVEVTEVENVTTETTATQSATTESITTETTATDTTTEISNQEVSTEQLQNENNNKPAENTNGEEDAQKQENGQKQENAPNTDNDNKNQNNANNSSKLNSGSSASISRSGYSSGSSSSSTTTSTTSTSVETTSMFTIANGDKMMVTMYVDELDIGTMQVGQETEITLDAIEGETFSGVISNVSGNASSSGGSSQYPVEIIFDKTDAMLSGMNASVEVIVEQAENVLVVPLSAIQDEGNMSYVYTAYDEDSDTLSGKVQVTLGLSDETNVEITAGLAEGDTVYYEMQGSEDNATGNSGMNGFTMPGGMNGMPSGGGGFPGGGDFQGDGSFPSGGNGGNRGQRGGMGGR